MKWMRLSAFLGFAAILAASTPARAVPVDTNAQVITGGGTFYLSSSTETTLGTQISLGTSNGMFAPVNYDWTTGVSAPVYIQLRGDTTFTGTMTATFLPTQSVSWAWKVWTPLDATTWSASPTQLVTGTPLTTNPTYWKVSTSQWDNSNYFPNAQIPATQYGNGFGNNPAIWSNDQLTTPVYFTAKVQLVAVPTLIGGSRPDLPSGSQANQLDTLLVRASAAYSQFGGFNSTSGNGYGFPNNGPNGWGANGGNADVILGATAPNAPNHALSQVTTIPRLKMEYDGDYPIAKTTGYFLSSPNNGNRDNTAVRTVGYIQGTQGDVYTFFVKHDDGGRVTVGDQTFSFNGANASWDSFNVQFNNPGTNYYPITTDLYQGGGARGIEVAARKVPPAMLPTVWTPADLLADANRVNTFPLVGDGGADGFLVWSAGSNAAAMGVPILPANPTDRAKVIGANTPPEGPLRDKLGNVVIPGQAGNGLRLQVTAPIASAINDLGQATVLLNRATGNRGFNQPLPQAAYAAPGDAMSLVADTPSSSFNYADLVNSTSQFGGATQFPGLSSAVDNQRFMSRLSGLLYIPQAGTYSYSLSSNEGGRLQIAGADVARFWGGRDNNPALPTYGFVNFPQAGLYPVQAMFFENTGTSGFQLSRGGFDAANGQPKILLSNADISNAATQGFSTSFAGQVYTANPVATLRVDGGRPTTIVGSAYTNVPALGLNTSPETWTLSKRISGPARIPGLLGTYYDFSSDGNTYPAGTGQSWLNGKPLTVPINGRVNPSNDFQTGTCDTNTFWNTGNFINDMVPVRGGTGATDQFGVSWKGYINIPQTGYYSFRQSSDDRSWMFLDINNDGTMEIPPLIAYGQNSGLGDNGSGNDYWNNEWENVYVTEGLHALEIRMREWGGGQNGGLQWLAANGWQWIDSSYLSQNMFDGAWVALASGTGQIGDLGSEGMFVPEGYFPFGSTAHLRLTSEIAGDEAIVEGDFIFVPEPATMILLGAGLLALARRRRRARAAA